MEEILVCPSCHSADNLATIESLEGLAGCEKITTEDTKWSGHTQVLWDTTTTIGVHCMYCDWEWKGPDWHDKLVVQEDEVVVEHEEGEEETPSANWSGWWW